MKKYGFMLLFVLIFATVVRGQVPVENSVAVTKVNLGKGRNITVDGTYQTKGGWECYRIELTVYTTPPGGLPTVNGGDVLDNPTSPWTSNTIRCGISGNSIIQVRAFFREIANPTNTEEKTATSTTFFIP
jgi:hypothetical protein